MIGHPPGPGLTPARSLIANLRAGLDLAFFRRVPPARFRASFEQVVLLALVNLQIGFGLEWLLTEPPREFFANGFAVHAAWLLSTLLLGFLAHREVSSADSGISRLVVMLLSPLPVGWLGLAALELTGKHWEALGEILEDVYYGQLFALWVCLVYARVLQSYTGLPLARVGSLALTYGLLWLHAFDRLPSAYVWHTATPSGPAEATEAPPIDAERVLHGQRTRVEVAIANLERERPGVADLYFVGFASDSREDVFMKEVRAIRELLDLRFDTAGRSVLLLNHRETLASVPLATASNLSDALSGLAGVMNPREDVLLIYLTGHGSRDHELRIRFPGLPLNSLDPDRLGEMLESSGIEWPVVIVSACYSGGYIDRLRGEQAMVLTAAASDRTSFGCGVESEMTYFARAYFEEQLVSTRDLVAAFDAARARLEAWETSEGKTHSEPQIALGDAMARKLERLRARLESGSAQAPSR